MIDLKRYADLLDKKVKITCTDGDILLGVWIDWTSEMDNEPDPESMTILNDDGIQIEIFINEIKDIEEA